MFSSRLCPHPPTAFTKIVTIVKYGALSASHIFFASGSWNRRHLEPVRHRASKKLVDASLQSRRTQEKRCSCSSAYLLLFEGGMRSPSWLHSTPCDTPSWSNFHARGFVLVELKINNKYTGVVIRSENDWCGLKLQCIAIATLSS